MQNSLVNSDSSTTFVLLLLGIWQSWWSFHWLCLFHGLNSEVRGVIAKDHYYPFSLSTLSNFQYIQALKTKKLKIKRWLTRERLVSCNLWIRFLWFGPIAKHYILAFLILILWCFSKQNFFWSVIDTRALQYRCSQGILLYIYIYIYHSYIIRNILNSGGFTLPRIWI